MIVFHAYNNPHIQHMRIDFTNITFIVMHVYTSFSHLFLLIPGFLSTGDDTIPGNMGLSDQAMALRWVRENIHNFQGEPDRITLVGHEAGAACVGIHLISPITSKYLYHSL